MNESQETINPLSQRFNPLTEAFDIVPTEHYIRRMTDQAITHRLLIDQGVIDQDGRRIVHLTSIEDRVAYLYSQPIDAIEIHSVLPSVVDSLMFFRERATGALSLKAPLIMQNYYPADHVDPDHSCMIEFAFGTATLYRMMKPDFDFLHAV